MGGSKRSTPCGNQKLGASVQNKHHDDGGNNNNNATQARLSGGGTHSAEVISLRVDCATQTEPLAASTAVPIAATCRAVSTTDSILARSRSTQTAPHAHSVFTRSAQFLPPARDDATNNVTVQTDFGGPIIPGNQVIHSGDRRGGGVGRSILSTRGGGAFGGVMFGQRGPRAARRVNFMVADQGFERVEARMLADELAIVEDITALLEERITLATMQAKAAGASAKAGAPGRAAAKGSALLPVQGSSPASMQTTAKQASASQTNSGQSNGGLLAGGSGAQAQSSPEPRLFGQSVMAFTRPPAVRQGNVDQVRQPLNLTPQRQSAPPLQSSPGPQPPQPRNALSSNPLSLLSILSPARTNQIRGITKSPVFGRSDAATSTGPQVGGSPMPVFGFSPRRGLELGTNPLYVADPPNRGSTEELNLSAFSKAVVRIQRSNAKPAVSDFSKVQTTPPIPSASGASGSTPNSNGAAQPKASTAGATGKLPSLLSLLMPFTSRAKQSSPSAKRVSVQGYNVGEPTSAAKSPTNAATGACIAKASLVKTTATISAPKADTSFVSGKRNDPSPMQQPKDAAAKNSGSSQYPKRC